MLQTELLELTPEEFNDLQQSGTLYKLYPQLKGHIVNVQQFIKLRNDYLLDQAVFNFVFDICESTGADPADIWELVSEHKDNIELFLQRMEDVSIDDIVESIRGRD